MHELLGPTTCFRFVGCAVEGFRGILPQQASREQPISKAQRPFQVISTLIWVSSCDLSLQPACMDPAIQAFFQEQIQAAELRLRQEYEARSAQKEAAFQQHAAEAAESWNAQKSFLEEKVAALEHALAETRIRSGRGKSDPNAGSVQQPILVAEPEQEEMKAPATPKRRSQTKVAQTPPATPLGTRRKSTRGSASMPTTPASPRTTRSSTRASTAQGDASTSASPSPVPTLNTPSRTRKPTSAASKARSTPTPPAESQPPTRPAKPKQLLRKEIPVDALLLKDHAFTHFRLISGCLAADDVPEDVDPATLAAFYARFSNEDAVLGARSGPPLISKTSVKVYPYQPAEASQSRNLSRLAMIESTVVDFIATKMARMGISRWTPNYNEAPGSLYNTAISILFIDTFRQAIVSGAYDFNGNQAWKKYTTDMDLLLQIYDHVTHFHFFQIWKEEKRNKGSARFAKERQAMYAVKRKKAKARRNYLKTNKHHRLAKLLIDVKATSDEEQDPAGAFLGQRPIYHPRFRPERSAGAEECIRLIDRAIDSAKGLKKNGIRRDPILIAPPRSQQKITMFPALPPNMPIDYYDPDFFNQLPLELRKKANIGVLVLPGKVEKSLNRKDADGKLTGKQLMEKYGDDVLSCYDLDGFSSGDEGDLSGDGDNESDGDEFDDGEECGSDESEELEDEGEGEGEGIGDEDATMSVLDEEEEREHEMFSRRSTLAAQLSVGNAMDFE
ncbi:hypothetical protein D9611_014574 [Ephemerocybe angulata]|uniref:Uncharacterized protein n=1 Tax=Ephemerocybe angulata TaxID=980116 RepID=A0A8H5C5C1_9AGAR|nr:hypothetical protein D9611_014574 [Tulosesus angulatus]